jgi:hypothetical protein
MHSVRVFNVRVLAASMLRFVGLVRSSQAAALPTHQCHARATLVVLLCDFLQLVDHHAQAQATAFEQRDVCEL